MSVAWKQCVNDHVYYEAQMSHERTVSFFLREYEKIS